MWSQGIQAVGDISNKTDTFDKTKQQIAYYTLWRCLISGKEIK
jgi:hypothetical protein